MKENQLQTPPNLLLPKDMDLTPKKITKEALLKKFEQFKNDNTNVEKVQKQGIDWMQPGYLIQLFVADFSDLSLLASSDEYYKRYTGIAKVLSCSTENTRVAEVYSSIKPGDIILCGDDLLHMTTNPAWQQWYDANGRIMKGVEPLKYIRKYHRWIEHGMLYLIDRDHEVINKEGLEISLATIGELKVPLVFRIPVQDVICKINNPFNQ